MKIKITQILFWAAMGWTLLSFLGGGLVTAPLAVLVWIAWLVKKVDKHVEG